MMDIPICTWIAKTAYNLAYNPDFLESNLLYTVIKSIQFSTTNSQQGIDKQVQGSVKV